MEKEFHDAIAAEMPGGWTNSDADILAWATTPVVTYRAVTSYEIGVYVDKITTGENIFAPIKNKAKGGVSVLESTQELAIKADRFLSDPARILAMETPADRAYASVMLGQLAAKGMLGTDVDPETNPHKAAIMAMGETEKTWGELNGFKVTPGLIERARNAE